MIKKSTILWSLAMALVLALSSTMSVAGASNVNYTEYVGGHHDTQATAPQTKASTGTSGYGHTSYNRPNDPDKSVRMYDRSAGIAHPWWDGVNEADNFYLNNNVPAGRSVMMQVRSSLWTSYYTTVKGYWRSN